MLTTRSSTRRNRSALMLAAMLAIGQCPMLARAVHAAPASTQPAAVAAQVPVREVVLFSSGVGYFEHYGTVKDNASTELSFKREQINDVLKSLLLEDLDKGLITSVTYGSQGPLAHTLKSFEVDITANPPLADLLNQLRGARVTITIPQQAPSSGTILGVEKRQRPVSGGPNGGGVIDVWMLNLVTDAGSIHQVELEQVSDVKLDDPKLQQELGKALAALAQSRDQDKKPVTVHFRGAGERRVRIGYVVETPVWKTSYRLVLPESADALPGAPATAPAAPAASAVPNSSRFDRKDENIVLAADVIPAPATQPAAIVRKPGETGKLQGWAIVENQTDNDWTDVQLSLMSGRPISFIEDLYQPLYVPRPTVQPQLYASLRPQTYEEGMDARVKVVDQLKSADGKPMEKRARQMQKLASQDDKVQETLADAAGAPQLQQAAQQEQQQLAQMDATSSVASIASATRVGELFEYTVGNVTLPRQQSAMIPIVTDSVSAKRLSIYNASVMPRNPLLGARLTNDTGKLLPQGPLTVLDGGSYAGDANIEDLPNGQNRLISYGVDQQMVVNSTAVKENQSLLTGKIVKGVLEMSYRHTFTQDYVAENKSDHAKALLIEHTLHPGWKLVEPEKADETTDALYRFEGSVASKHESKLTVREELVAVQRVELLPLDVGPIQTFTTYGEIPQPVKNALAQAAKLKANVVDAQRELQQRVQKIAEITAEQNRIRDNMKTVAQNTDYYQRLLKKLDQQENQIETLQAEVKQWQQKQQAAQQELEQYLHELSVG